MWSQFVLCLLVGLAAASTNNGWKSNTEYTYKVRGRTLTALHEVDNQYSGILLKANLIVRPQEQGKLLARLDNCQYGQVHTVLPNGWKSEIPESKVQFQELPLSSKHFEIILEDGIVTDVIVDSKCHNWEANLIKSIVSQIQFDTQGKQVVKSHLNQLPDGKTNSANFKTMETTITGKYETTYDISRLPEYILQSKPWLVPFPHLKNEGEFIQVVKSKNFSHSQERVDVHFGLGFNKEWEPSSNQLGSWFSRSSVSRAVLSGSLNKYTIQSSETVNKIVLSPTLNSEQKGMVVSQLNMTLSNVQENQGEFGKVSNGKRLGGIMYTYNTPFDGEHEAKSRMHNKYDSSEETESDEVQYKSRAHRYNGYNKHHKRSVDSFAEYSFPKGWNQALPKLHEEHQAPLLPMSIGYKGKSIKTSDKVNIVEACKKISEQIGREVESAEEIRENIVLGKFTVLTNIVRIMNEKEIRQCSEQLFTTEKEGHKTNSWKAFRDAVATSGTGPALILIKDWIRQEKIRREEAAQVFATMCQSVRMPTEEYMRNLYDVAKENVKNKAIVNETAILSFSSLVRKVYVDKQVSHNEFPVHAYGKFYDEHKAETFVCKEYVPYLSQELRAAIRKGDARKAIVYTRALGKVGHKCILEAFESFLEGKQQCSNFLRFQMVVAMENLVQVYPSVARAVLYKIYSNVAELQVIRCAAVFQLMRTNPPAAMLQRMAEFTNMDVDEQVNACVKSAIETAAKLEGPQFADFAENARTAAPLLTKKTYGMHQSRNLLVSYVEQEMDSVFYQNAQSYGSEDSLFPRGLKYRLAAAFGGANTEIINVEGIVSSIDELTNVFARNTELYQQQQKQQKQHFQDAKQNQWSSEHIVNKLKIENEEREQLEGSFLFQLGGGATRFFTFDNQTIELLPQVIREIEESLREGQDLHYSKFINRREMTIAFPTEMSLPFFYTMDAPTYMRIKGELRATAEPQISSGSSIHKPHTINAEAKIDAVLATKVQTKLGFVCSFNHQQYVAGFDKNVIVNIPVKTQMKVDLKNKQMRVEFEPLHEKKNQDLFHYSTYPYTDVQDVFDLSPVSKNMRIIKSVPKERQTRFETVIGKKSGMAFRVQYESEQQVMDKQWIYEQLQRQNPLSALMSPFVDETILRTECTVQYAGEMSHTRKVVLRFGYQQHYETEESNDSESRADIQQLAALPEESKARQHDLVKYISAGIRNADIRVVDAEIEIEGDHQTEYSASLAWARSRVDDRCRCIFYAKKEKDTEDNKKYHVAMLAEGRFPNTNGLDYEFALKYKPEGSVKADFIFGEHFGSASKVNMHAQFRQSESRRQYLETLGRHQECLREMQEGNKQLPACANMTQEANLMDRVQVKFNFDNFSHKMTNATLKLYNAIRYLTYFQSEQNVRFEKTMGMPKSAEIEARFEPTFEYCNISLTSDKLDADFQNIRVNNWAKQLVAVHPVFPAYTRLFSEALELDTFRPFCTIDRNAANTFDNKTYSTKLGHNWHVALVYVPDFARVGHRYQKYEVQQEEHQLEQYAVLVRDAKSGEQHKEVKMTIRTPESQGQLIEIDLTPAGSKAYPKVQVNNKEYQYSEKRSTDIEGGLIKIYGLPNGEVKVEVRRAFYIIFDGETVKITAMHQKLRDAVRGLCGNFNGLKYDEFTTPKKCILRSPYQFAATYAVEEDEHIREQKTKAERSGCVRDQVILGNVITEHDMGKRYFASKDDMFNGHRLVSMSESCTMQIAQYKIEGNQVCFTRRPIPVCKSYCNGSEKKFKSVSVHCVERTSSVEGWMRQLERGEHVDFSNKSETKTIEFKIPEQCTRY